MSTETNFGVEDVTTLEDYLAAIRNRKWVVLATALALLALTFIVTAGRIDTYTATASVEVGPTPDGATTEGELVPGNLDLERKKLVSDKIADRVAAGLAGETAATLRLDLRVSGLSNLSK